MFVWLKNFLSGKKLDGAATMGGLLKFLSHNNEMYLTQSSIYVNVNQYKTAG